MQENKPQSAWAILGCAWLLGFAMFARVLCFPPIAHIIKEELILSHEQLGLVFSVPVAVLAALAIPSGLVADRIGIRKAAGTGAAIMALGSLATGTSTNYMTLLAFTALFGVGLSLVYPSLPKLVGAYFPQEKAGLATAIYVTGIVIGAALALALTLPVVFPITSTFQGTFYIWSFPAVAAAILWWIVVKEPSLSHSGLQSEQIGKRNRRSHPVWKNRSLWLVALAFFCLNVHFYTWSGWTPALMMLKGASADLAALITSIMLWVSVPIILLMPWASYKIGLRKPFIWAPVSILVLASWSAMYIPVSLGWGLMVVVGITLNTTFPIILSLPVEMMPRESVGTASGFVLSIGYTGGLVGPWLAGYVMDATGTLDLALVVLVGVAIAWACIGFMLPETGPKARLRK